MGRTNQLLNKTFISPVDFSNYFTNTISTEITTVHLMIAKMLLSVYGSITFLYQVKAAP